MVRLFACASVARLVSWKLQAGRLWRFLVPSPRLPVCLPRQRPPSLACLPQHTFQQLAGFSPFFSFDSAPGYKKFSAGKTSAIAKHQHSRNSYNCETPTIARFQQLRSSANSRIHRPCSGSVVDREIVWASPPGAPPRRNQALPSAITRLGAPATHKQAR